MKTGAKTRLVLDLWPLLAFFIAYRTADLFMATAVLVAATILSLALIYRMEKKLAVMPLVTAVAVVLFGTLTLILHEEFFIKIKPTLVNVLFAAILLGGLALKKNMLKYVLGEAMQLREAGWRMLTRNWGLYFIFLAVLNEIIWRNFSTDFWVNFKVFGMFTCTLVFTACQIPLIKKYWLEEEGRENF